MTLENWSIFVLKMIQIFSTLLIDNCLKILIIMKLVLAHLPILPPYFYGIKNLSYKRKQEIFFFKWAGEWGGGG